MRIHRQNITVTLLTFLECRPGVHSFRTGSRPFCTVRGCTCAGVVHSSPIMLASALHVHLMAFHLVTRFVSCGTGSPWIL